MIAPRALRNFEIVKNNVRFVISVLDNIKTEGVPIEIVKKCTFEVTLISMCALFDELPRIATESVDRWRCVQYNTIQYKQTSRLPIRRWLERCVCSAVYSKVRDCPTQNAVIELYDLTRGCEWCQSAPRLLRAVV